MLYFCSAFLFCNGAHRGGESGLETRSRYTRWSAERRGDNRPPSPFSCVRVFPFKSYILGGEAANERGSACLGNYIAMTGEILRMTSSSSFASGNIDFSVITAPEEEDRRHFVDLGIACGQSNIRRPRISDVATTLLQPPISPPLPVVIITVPSSSECRSGARGGGGEV